MKSATLWAAAAALLGLSPGCDDGSKFTVGKSNDIFVNPPVVDFNRVPVGKQSDPRIIEIRQGGETALTVNEIYIEGYEGCDRVSHGINAIAPFPGELDESCEFAIDERPELPLVLDEDEFRQVTVRYRSRNAEPPEAAELVVKSDARDKEEVTVTLSVRGAKPRISATERVISFAGPIASQRADLMIRNVGTGLLTVRDFVVELSTPGATDEHGNPIAEFHIDTENDLPWEIAENGYQVVSISYQPVDEQADAAQLVFLSDDPEDPRFAISLTSQPVYAVIEVKPNPIVFEGSGIGEATKVLSVLNPGLKALEVTKMEIEQLGSDYSLSGQPSFTVPGGGENDGVLVRYNPASAEGSHGTLVIKSNGDNAVDGETRISIVSNRQALPAMIQVDPVSVDMSDVAAGASGTAVVTVTNPGASPVSVSRIAFDTDPDSQISSDPEFSVTAGGDPLTLAPEQTHEIEATFARGAADRVEHIGFLLIESDAVTSPDKVYFRASAPPATGE